MLEGVVGKSVRKVLVFCAAIVMVSSATAYSECQIIGFGSTECKIDVPTSTIMLNLCAAGMMVTRHSGGAPGEGLSQFRNQGLNSPGSWGYEACCTEEWFMVNSGGKVYFQSDLYNTQKAYQVSPAQILTTFHLTKFGEDMWLNINFTAVKNGILIHYSAYNADDKPRDFGWKYMYNLHLGSYSDEPNPYVKVDHREKGSPYPDGVYRSSDQDFGGKLGSTEDVRYVKQWYGPDKSNDAKNKLHSWFWWNADWGADPAQLIQYNENWAAYTQAQSGQWTYSSAGSGQWSNGMLQWYYGKPQLIEFQPGETRDYIMWLATDFPDPLIAYSIAADFANRAEGTPSATLTMDAGETATFPIRVKSDTGYPQAVVDQMGGKAPSADALAVEQTVTFSLSAVEMPEKWSAKVVDPETGQDMLQTKIRPGETRLVHLKVTAPDDAFGNDNAQIYFRASMSRPPAGTVYNKKMSDFETELFTTSSIRPIYGIELHAPEQIPDVMPGETVDFPPIMVRNTGNLRQPLNVLMDIAAGLRMGWGKDISPDRFSIPRGQTKEVKLTLDIPVDEFGGDATLVMRASLEDYPGEFNTTQLKFRILSDAFVQIVPSVDQIVLAPGERKSFDALVTNLGFEPVDLALGAVADQTLGLGLGVNANSDKWDIQYNADEMSDPLQPGQTVKVKFEVSARDGLQAGEQQNLLLFLTKKGQTFKLDEELVRAVVGRVSNIDIEALVSKLSGDPGRPLEYVFTVKNVGNAIENLTVELSKLPPFWVWEATPSKKFQLNKDETHEVHLTLSSSPKELAKTYELGVIVRNADQVPSAELEIEARVNQIFGVVLTTETPVQSYLPKDDAAMLITVRNSGNGEDQFVLDGFGPEWNVVVDHNYQGLEDTTIDPQTRSLMPEETTTVRVAGKIGVPLGTYTVPIEAVSVVLGDRPAESEPLVLTVVVALPDLYIKDVRVVSNANFEGDIETVVAEIENLGKIEAKSVRVALFANGQATGTYMDFDKLAPDRTLVASLPWVKSTGAPSYRIVVDPEGAITEDNEDNNERVLQSTGLFAKSSPKIFGSDSDLAKAVPTPSPLVFLVALAGVGLLVRRLGARRDEE